MVQITFEIAENQFEFSHVEKLATAIGIILEDKAEHFDSLASDWNIMRNQFSYIRKQQFRSKLLEFQLSLPCFLDVNCPIFVLNHHELIGKLSIDICEYFYDDLLYAVPRSKN